MLFEFKPFLKSKRVA